jgi:endo-1,4-beta-mannosidase
MLQKQFVTGINYWPARKAMYWWHDFDLEEVREDFKKIALHNFKVVRIFLTWEAFQPLPDQASPRCLNNLQAVADTARRFHLQIMPTLFCGHMSGVNWMPEWMLESESSPGRFRVYSRNHLSHRKIKNYYLERSSGRRSASGGTGSGCPGRT